MIISLHTPKAGGTSFKRLLKNHFETSYKEDYLDFPLNVSKSNRILTAIKFNLELKMIGSAKYKNKNIQCIHGHFLPYKYSFLLKNKDVLFITWLRDPIERLCSHYFHWLRTYDKATTFGLHKKVIEEKWSLEDFCMSKEMRNVYATFLWNFPIQNFDFVGITEYFEEDFLYFANKFLKVNPNEIPKQNINPISKKYEALEESFVEKLKVFHRNDYLIYEIALNRRESRLPI